LIRASLRLAWFQVPWFSILEGLRVQHRMGFQGFFSSLHVFLYQATSGRIGGKFRGGPVLLLTTTGRKTGKKRTTPLLYSKEGNRIVVIASNSGAAHNPAWWTNLQSNREA